MDKKISMPVIISAIAIVGLIAGYFIFSSITGGKVGQGVLKQRLPLRNPAG